MKRVTLIIAFIYLAFNANAIEVTTELNRIITVTGSAEIVIPPDEIELEITLTENNSWKSLSKIELAFMKLLFGNDIEKDRVVFNSTNSSFYWYYWWHHRRDSRKSKKIILKLDAKTNFMKLVRDLDKEYVTSIRITKTSNKDLQKFRREVKIEAIKAAKTKAKYLLEAVDEKVGRLMQVDELQVIDNNQYWGQQNRNVVSNSVMSYSKTRGSYIENVPEIKLRYEVKTKFEID
ncbi:MAG: SIMPL domain-containing protein [Flavobacteriales bacterium]|nr:SIMPL domain-containing protein [Flavobacteriales bacterium]